MIGNPRNKIAPCFDSNDISFSISINNQLGDMNADSEVDVVDVILVIELVLTNQYNDLADLNLDSVIDILDVVQLINIILN